MTIQIVFNRQISAINAFPSTLAGAKATILNAFNGILPTTNFNLKVSFMNRSSKLQIFTVTTEAQYRSLLNQIPNTSTTITFEVVPVFSPKDRRDIVTIEDEKTGTVFYVDCKHTKGQNTPQKQSKMSGHQSTMSVPNPNETQHKAAFNQIPKTNPQTSSSKPMYASQIHKEPEFICTNCRCKLGRVRYASTAVADFDLCSNCFSVVRHPYAMIEYVDGKPTRRLEPPKQSIYQKPYSANPYSRYEPPWHEYGSPWHEYGSYNYPSYGASNYRSSGRTNRAGFGDFFPFGF
jgi:hypothetical protein